MNEKHTPELRQERDRVAARRVLAVALAAVVIALLAVAWAGWLLTDFRRKLGRDAPVTETLRAPEQIGLVDQTLLGASERGRRLREEQRARLERYGWVDRERGIVHIPIDEAIELVLARKEER